MITYLKPEFDSAKSFYNKAVVEIDENGNKHLYSYNTLVCELDGLNSVAKVYNVQSQTTLRHIKEFLRQNGFVADNKKQIVADYWAA